jgi:hypothetical protein
MLSDLGIFDRDMAIFVKMAILYENLRYRLSGDFDPIVCDRDEFDTSMGRSWATLLMHRRNFGKNRFFGRDMGV